MMKGKDDRVETDGHQSTMCLASFVAFVLANWTFLATNPFEGGSMFRFSTHTTGIVFSVRWGKPTELLVRAVRERTAAVIDSEHTDQDGDYHPELSRENISNTSENENPGFVLPAAAYNSLSRASAPSPCRGVGSGGICSHSSVVGS